MAISADGKIATSSRSIHTFGSPHDSRHLHELRASADAILCGARTVEETRATLGNGSNEFTRTRIASGLAPHPIRVVVSGSASFSPTAHLWQHRFSPIHLWITDSAPSHRTQPLQSLADHVFVSPGNTVDLHAGLLSLARDFNVRSVMVEGGGGLNDAFFQADLVDELHLTWCPLIFGGALAPTISDGSGIARLADATRFHLASCEPLGDELFLVYRKVKPPHPA
jgi:riboflavin-specific deaminase-like protein